MNATLRKSLVAAAAAMSVVGAAFASDEKAFAELKAKYEKAAKNHDDSGIRDRRKILLALFDHLDQKACRKLLREAFDGDDAVDTRVAVVQVLGASGDPKDLDVLVAGVGKDKKLRGPSIALGEGLSYTAPAAAAAASAHAVELAAKAKGDVKLALLEGVGELGDPSVYEALVALGEKWLPEEHYVVNTALGSCGKEKAVAALVADAKSSIPLARLGAVSGLARSGTKESLAPLTDALHDLDPRVVETAATALAAAKHTLAASAMVDAMSTAPLRLKYVLRASLAALLGKDVGLNAAAWRDVIEGKKPEPAVVPADQPKLPQFFGISVATDRVVVLLDLGRRMSWQGRLTRAQEGIARYLEALDDTVGFNVFGCTKTTDRFSKGLCAGAASRGQAVAWVRKQLTGGGFNLKTALLQVLDEEADVDTILLATDSMPWGEGAAESAMEVLEVFRRANVTRRVRVHIAFVIPGGRVTTSEPEDEFEDRATILKLLAEGSGGKFVRVEQ
jgi:hypothetical protein